MKFYFFALFILVSTYCNAQKIKDSIPLYDFQQNGVKSNIIVKPLLISKNIDSSTIIVIDNKIYKAGNKGLLEYKKSDLILEYSITDSLSQSGIHKILVYKTHK